MSGHRAAITIVGLNYAPEKVGIGPYTAAMAESLAERGHEVSAIVGKPYYPQWEAVEGFGSGLWNAAVESGVSLVRCAHYIPAQPTGIRRIIHLASFGASALVPGLAGSLGLRGKRPDLVMVIAPALLSVPVAWLAAKMARAKLWIHVQDFEVEAAFATGLVSSGGVAAKIARWLENRMLALGDRVSTISPQMCAKLVEKGVAAERVVEIRNWADGRFLPDPTAGLSFRGTLAIGALRFIRVILPTSRVSRS